MPQNSTYTPWGGKIFPVSTAPIAVFLVDSNLISISYRLLNLIIGFCYFLTIGLCSSNAILDPSLQYLIIISYELTEMLPSIHVLCKVGHLNPHGLHPYYFVSILAFLSLSFRRQQKDLAMKNWMKGFSLTFFLFLNLSWLCWFIWHDRHEFLSNWLSMSLFTSF